MKLFTNLMGMAAAGTIGYLTEPKLRFDLTGINPSKTEIAANGRVVITMPGDKPEIDISKLAPEELPLKVIVKSDVKVADAAGGLTMVVAAGGHVNLVRLEGGNAVVSPAGTQAIGLIPIVETNLVEQIAAGVVSKKNLPQGPVTADLAKQGDSQEPVAIPEAPPIPEPAPTPPPTLPTRPPPEPTPAPVVIPEQPPAVAVEPEPTPPTAQPTGTKVESPNADVVKVMQESIRAAQIKEFTFAQVLDWNPEADETVDGEPYQVGLASYKAETIFGVKTIQAKALIKNGKVQRWIWPKSGMDIK